MALTAGARLGPYEILAPIGAGGMGEVYRGRDTQLDREIAIKVLPAALARPGTASSGESHPTAVISHVGDATERNCFIWNPSYRVCN